jgi:hypothetical protein
MEEIRNEYFWLDFEDKESINLCNFNRQLVQKHVNKIEKALKTNCKLFVNPIIVGMKDGEIQIIDGNHRFRAAFNLWLQGIKTDSKGNPLRLRVQCIQDKDIDLEDLMLQINNTSLKWSITNFIEFNAYKGNESCTNFLNFMDKTKIESVTEALAYFGHRSLTKAQAEQFDRFPYIGTEEMLLAECFVKQVQFIKTFANYSIYNGLGLSNSTGIRYLVSFFKANPSKLKPFKEWLMTNPRFMYQTGERSSTIAHFEKYYEQIFKTINEYV